MLAHRVAIALFFAAVGLRQADRAGTIAVGPNVQISRARAHDAHAESWIGIDPNDDRRMLACAMVNASSLRALSTSVFVSKNGGLDWDLSMTTDQFAQSGDPICTFGPDGTAYFAAGVLVEPPDYTQTFVYRSLDGGRTWSAPLRMPFVDREHLAFDDTAGPFQGLAYLHGTSRRRSLASDASASYGVSLLRSRDGFRTFEDMTSRDAVPPSIIFGMGNSVVTADGTLVLITGQVKDTTSRAQSRADWVQTPNAVLTALRSVDRGRTLEPASAVSEWYMARSGVIGAVNPHLAIDRSDGVFKDRLYAVWPDLRTGRLTINLSHSSDGGTRWSAPVVVDADVLVREHSHEGPDSVNPAVAVNNRGVVAVTWADRREHADNLGWHPRFAASLDGGDTFLPSVRLSAVGTTFGPADLSPLRVASDAEAARAAGADRAAISVRLEYFFYGEGDTTHIATDRAGRFHPTWIDNRTGVPQLWTAAVSVDGDVLRNGDRTLSDLADLSRDMRLETVEKSYDPATGTITLSVRVRNAGSSARDLPLTVRVISLTSQVGSTTVVSSDNGMTGPGAFWIFKKSAASRLSCGEATDARTLSFRLDQRKPVKTIDTFPRISVLDLDARVLGAVGTVRAGREP